MQQNDGNNMNVTSLIGGCLTKLFRACSPSGDGSTWDASFLNSLQAELINVVCKSCQALKTFDATDPSSYNQLWQALTRFGGRDGINEWASGTTDLIVTSGTCSGGCNLYLANTSGDPAGNQPSLTTDEHWYGPFCSLGAVTSKVYESLNVCSDKILWSGSQVVAPIGTTVDIALSINTDGFDCLSFEYDTGSFATIGPIFITIASLEAGPRLLITPTFAGDDDTQVELIGNNVIRYSQPAALATNGDNRMVIIRGHCSC